MSSITLYRADVESPRFARVLRKVPGVEVAGDGDTEPDSNETAPPRDDTETEDGGGLREKVPVPDTGGGKASAVKTYGLLGLGVSMVLLGIATVGIWVYRRRKNADGDTETPPPTTGIDTGTGDSTVQTTELSTPATSEAATTADTTDESESRDESPKPKGRTEDRSDVEWTTRETTPSREPSAEEFELTERLDQAEPTGTGDEADQRPTESVDAAPLLGVAFVALTGAVVRWVQGDEDEV
jgi:hypothetical protein